MGWTMIKSLMINNYKSLQMGERIDIGQLTILAGKNNVGKSATIQALLDIAKYNDITDNLNLSYEPLLSNFFRKVHNNDLESDISFYMEIDINNKIYKTSYKFSYDIKSKSGFISYFKIELIDTKLNISLEMNKKKLKSPYKVVANQIIEPIFAKVKDGVEELPSIFEGEGDVIFMGFVPLQIHFSFKNNPELNKWFDEDEDEDEDNVVFSLPFTKHLLRHYSSVKYIGPIRSIPKEYYLLGERSSTIGSDGEETIDVLDLLKDKKVKFYKEVSDKALTNISLLEAVQYWIEYFTGVGFELKDITDNLVQVLVNGHPINHSGFGISQLLPIIVQSLLMPEGSILFLEQPEIHLHPDLEMKLAIFLLCMVKNNRQIIAETHSEHIINQLTISKLDDINIDKLMRIYFFNKDGAAVDIKEIKIDNRGAIKNWPDGFFDQYLNFTKELMIRRKERAKKILKQDPDDK